MGSGEEPASVMSPKTIGNFISDPAVEAASRHRAAVASPEAPGEREVSGESVVSATVTMSAPVLPRGCTGETGQC